MNGLDALTDGLLQSTDRRYTVPGYPITDLGAKIRAEIVINEKTALEYAIGDSLMGRRAAVVIKNVGVNACADPLLQATAQGLIGGIVLVAGDDPDAIGSQTAQDSRYYGELAELPVVEPDPATCYSGVEAVLQASEQFSRVGMLRITPHILESEVTGTPVPRKNGKGRISDRVWTMHGRITAAEELYRELFSWSDASPLNRWNGETAGTGAESGQTRIVTVNPLPARAAGVATIHEHGRPFVRDHRGLKPPVPQERPQRMEDRGFYRTFCKNCPFKTLLDIMKDADLHPVCDAGCSVLAMNPPYSMGIASYGMGASIAIAARSTGSALIGDYALMHSGLNALVDVREKNLPLLCIVMRNSCTAMTGKQSTFDIRPYLTWAKPVMCNADDESLLRDVIAIPDRLRVVIVDGECPEGAEHETVEC
ncbi:MAG: thiamine pyrophosphate-dependent enzyme [Methanoregulaceae archaeon]